MKLKLLKQQNILNYTSLTTKLNIMLYEWAQFKTNKAIINKIIETTIHWYSKHYNKQTQLSSTWRPNTIFHFQKS